MILDAKYDYKEDRVSIPLDIFKEMAKMYQSKDPEVADQVSDFLQFIEATF